MFAPAFKYAFPNARARALKAGLLSPRDMLFLLEAKDETIFLSYLATTSYGPYLPALSTSERKEGHRATHISASHMERAILRPLFQDYKKIFSSLRQKGGRHFIKALHDRFEKEELKLLIRAKFSGLSREDVAHLSYPLSLSRLPWERLWGISRVEEIFGLLERSSYGRALSHARAQFEAQGRTFPLEMALDIASYSRLRQAASALPARLDRQWALRISGSHVDMANVIHIMRLRFRYGLSPEEALNYSLPGGRYLDLKGLHHLARAGDEASLLKRLPEGLGAASQATSLEEAELRLSEWFHNILRRAFLGYPFHIGVQAAYLFMKEMEAKAIVTIHQGKRLGLSEGEISARLPGFLFRRGEG